MEERDFIDFQFDGKWASEMNLKAVSSGDRYSPPMFGSVNPNIATMVGKEGIYKWNTQIGEKIFNISVAYDNITMEDLRKIAEWLNPFTIGKLVFKEQPYKYYWASLNSEPQISYVPFKTEEKEINGVKFKQGIFKGELSLSFVCISNYGYSDWSSFEEEFEYQETLLENQSNFYLENSSDKKMSITNIQGAQEQKIIQAEEGETVEGKGSIYLSDVDNTKESIVNISGGERQEKREGYNLFNSDKALTSQTKTQGGATVTKNNDKSFTVTGSGNLTASFGGGYIDYTHEETLKILKTGQYTCYFGAITYPLCAIQFFKKENDKETLLISRDNGSNIKAVIDITDEIINSTGLFIRVYLFGASGRQIVPGTIYPMLYEGTEEKPFEGYGATPSPDYPSDVEAVGDNVNLFDKDNINIINNNYLDENGDIVSLPNGVWSYTDYIEVNSNSVTLQGFVTGELPAMCGYDENKNFIKGIAYKNRSINILETDTPMKYVRFSIRTATDYSLIKLEPGSVATSYTPYGMGSVEINKVNKNFLPSFNDLQETNKNGLTYSIKDNKLKIKGTSTTDGSFSINISENITLNNGNYYLKSSKAIGNISCNLYDTNNKKITDLGWNMTNRKFTINGQTTIRKQVDLFYGSGATFDFEGYLFITNQEAATDYIPHESEVYNLPIQQPMLSGDTFVKEDGNWFEMHGWNKDIFDETDNFSTYITNDVFQFYLPTTIDKNATLLCNMFIQKNDWISTSVVVSTNSQLYFLIKKGEYGFTADLTAEQALTKFKEIIATNNIILYNTTNTPTKLPCTPEQTAILEQLYNNPLYNGINNIFTSNELATINTHYNFVTYSPSPNKPSEVRAVGDNINYFNKDTVIQGKYLNYQNQEIENSTWTYSDYIPCKPNENWIISGYSTIGGAPARCFYDKNKSFLSGGAHNNRESMMKFTTPNNCYFFRESLAKANIDTVKIEKSKEATEYSPYSQGGSKITVLNSNFLEKQEQSTVTAYGITANVKSDGSIVVNGTTTIDLYIRLTTELQISAYNETNSWKKYHLSKGSYKFSCDISGTSSSNNIHAYIKENNVIGNTCSVLPNLITSKENTFELTDKIEYVAYVWIQRGTNLTDFTMKFMLKKSDDTSDYIQNKQKEYILDIQKPMLQGDYFVKEADGWKEVHGFDYVDTKNVETLEVNLSTSSPQAEGFYRYNINLGLNNRKSGWNLKLICTHFENKNVRWNTTLDGICGWENGYNLCIGTHDENYNTTESMKTFLQNNDVGIYYELATPTKLPCTEEQSYILDQLENNSSYLGTTNVLLNSSISPTATVKYIQNQPIYINFVPQGSNLLNNSSFYENNLIFTNSFFDEESGDPSTSGVSNDRPIYLQNAGNYNANLNLTFDLIRINEDEPLVISIYKTGFDNNGNFINLEEEPYSQITLESYLKYKPFADIYDDNINNWQIQIDSELSEVYIKHKTDKEKIVSINKFNKNQTFLHLADCKNVDYLKPFPTSKSEIKDSAIKDIVLNKIIVESSTANYRLKNVKLDWKHTYI